MNCFSSEHALPSNVFPTLAPVVRVFWAVMFHRVFFFFIEIWLLLLFSILGVIPNFCFMNEGFIVFPTQLQIYSFVKLLCCYSCLNFPPCPFLPSLLRNQSPLCCPHAWIKVTLRSISQESVRRKRQMCVLTLPILDLRELGVCKCESDSESEWI